MLSDGPVQGWPVVLKTFPAAEGADPAPAPSSSPSKKKKKKKKAGGNGMPWLHTGMKKSKADEKLTEMGNNDGNFLVRGPAEKRVLSVVYKGQPTHHAIKPGEDGNLQLNNRTYGKPTTSLKEVRRRERGKN